MMIRLRNFVFDERDLFILLLVIVPFAAHQMNVSLGPFRSDSLVVTAIFLLLNRIVIPQTNMTAYVVTTCVGLLLSMTLSPYGLAIFYAIGIFFYARRTL